MRTEKKVAMLALLVSLLFIAGCYTQVGRPKVKTEGDVSEEYYFEEQYAEEGVQERAEERADTVVYHRHDVYFHPPAFYRPLWIDYWWWDAWSWYYDPYWYWGRGLVPGYYVSFHFGWVDPWWPCYYPFYGPEVYYWRPLSYYGGWAYYSPYYWYDVERLPPPKRRPFARRHLPLMGGTGVAVSSGGSGSEAATLSKRAIGRRTTTIAPAKGTVSRETLSKRAADETKSLRRVPRTEAAPKKRVETTETRRRRSDEALRVKKSPARRSVNKARARPHSSPAVRKSTTTRSVPRVRKASPPPKIKPAPPPKRSSKSGTSARRRTRSEYTPHYVPRSHSSWPRSSSGSSGSYSPPTYRRVAPPPSSGSGGSSGGRPSRRRS